MNYIKTNKFATITKHTDMNNKNMNDIKMNQTIIAVTTKIKHSPLVLNSTIINNGEKLKTSTTRKISTS